jgi:hypothetical protein
VTSYPTRAPYGYDRSPPEEGSGAFLKVLAVFSGWRWRFSRSSASC